MIDNRTASRVIRAACGHAGASAEKLCEKCAAYSDLGERLRLCFRQGLALPATFDVTSVESASTRQWDSVAHLQLVVAIEEAFGIQLSPADVVDLRSYPSAITILQRHGVQIVG
jgi:hypothetical protein